MRAKRSGRRYCLLCLLVAPLWTAWVLAQEPVHLVRMADDVTPGQSANPAEMKKFLEGHASRLFHQPVDIAKGGELNPQFLGQAQFFEELARLEGETGIATKVELVTWGDAFRFFADYVNDRSNPPIVAEMGDSWAAYFESLNTIAFAQRQTWDVRVLWYWRDLVTDPSQLETGEGFAAVCQKIRQAPTEGLVAPFVIPTALEWNLLHDLSIWLYNAGSVDLISTEPKFGFIPWNEASLAGQAGEAATRFLVDLASNRYVDLPDKPAIEVGEDLLDRKYAMAILGTWVANNARERLGEDWTKHLAFTFPPRIGADRASTFKGGTLLVVIDPSRGVPSEAVERAMEVAHYLTSPESLERYWPAASGLPANEQLMARNPLLASFNQALEQGRSYPAIPEWAPVVENLTTRDNLYAFWKRLSALTLSGTSESPQQRVQRRSFALSALRTAEDEINRALSPGKVSALQPWVIGLLAVAAPIAFVGLWRRSRQRRLTEVKIRRSEQRYRDLYENAPDMFCSVDMNGRITQCNRMVEEKTGFSRDEVLGKHLYDMYHPDSHSRLKEAIRHFGEERQVRDAEMQLKKKDGSKLDVSTNVSAVRDADGEILGIRAIWRDITHRKQTELELQQQREALAHVARVATVGEMAASLAHELNQPLAAIVSNAQAGKRIMENGRGEREEILETLQDIAADGKRAGAVIRHVRELLRKGTVSFKELDLNQVVKSIEKILRADAALQGVSLKMELDPSLPPVLGDEIQLQQILLNLVLNATEAMSGQAEPRNVILRTAGGSGSVEVSVEDSGPGIASGDFEEIFEAFYTTKPTGLGMGLSISRSIVRDHGGELSARPNVDRGLTFLFQLPMHLPQAQDESGLEP